MIKQLFLYKEDGKYIAQIGKQKRKFSYPSNRRKYVETLPKGLIIYLGKPDDSFDEFFIMKRGEKCGDV